MRHLGRRPHNDQHAEPFTAVARQKLQSAWETTCVWRLMIRLSSRSCSTRERLFLKRPDTELLTTFEEAIVSVLMGRDNQRISVFLRD